MVKVMISRGEDGTILAFEQRSDGEEITDRLFSKLIPGVSKIENETVLYRVELDVSEDGTIEGWGTNPSSGQWLPEQLVEQIVPGYSKIVNGHVITSIPDDEPEKITDTQPTVAELQAQLAEIQKQISLLTK